MIKITVSHDIQKYIDRLNTISLDIQTAAAEASEATALNLQEINPEYAVVNVSSDGSEFLISAENIGYEEEIIVEASEVFINTFKESFKNLRNSYNGY